jgi:hypothetical protein
LRSTLISAGIGWLAAAGGAYSAPAVPIYRDVTSASGLNFVHDNGAVGTKQYQEVMGSGVALLDYDGDGRLDVYLVNSKGGGRLFRNLGGLRFEDVTAPAKLSEAGYGMGATAADFDNDGDTDLFISNWGPNAFYRNQGNGTFANRTTESGLGDARWGAGASFFDYDRDGKLDLFVVNYIELETPDQNVCQSVTGLRLYCPPRQYPPASSLLYRNLGTGKFQDVSAAAGIAPHRGRGLGVVTLDYDRDGWTDVYVANDLDPNFLFRNKHDGTFEELGVIAGVSHSEDGLEQSGMGLAAADFDRDGWVDLFVTNYLDQTNELYRNEGNGFFDDVTARSGLGPPSLPWVGWGTEFVDFDHDGWFDIVVVNGNTESDAAKVDPTGAWPHPAQLYRNQGNGTFRDVGKDLAPDLVKPRTSRGAAFGDLDDDGDIDIILSQQEGAAVVLEHTGVKGANWIGFRLQGTKSNRDAVGSRVEVHAAGRISVREVQAGGSYLSSNDPRLHFGLGAAAAVDSVVVTWPRGDRALISRPALNRYHRVVEGSPAR